LRADDVEVILGNAVSLCKTNPNSPCRINSFGVEAAGVEFIDETVADQGGAFARNVWLARNVCCERWLSPAAPPVIVVKTAG
jgi:hypothetical protein